MAWDGRPGGGRCGAGRGGAGMCAGVVFVSLFPAQRLTLALSLLLLLSSSSSSSCGPPPLRQVFANERSAVIAHLPSAAEEADRDGGRAFFEAPSVGAAKADLAAMEEDDEEEEGPAGEEEGGGRKEGGGRAG